MRLQRRIFFGESLFLVCSPSPSSQETKQESAADKDGGSIGINSWLERFTGDQAMPHQPFLTHSLTG